MKNNYLKIWSLLLGIIVSMTTQAQSFSISPTSAKQGETLKVTITGTNTKFGQGSSCISPVCHDVNNLNFYILGSSTVTNFPDNNYRTVITDSTHAEVEISLPYGSAIGTFSVKLDNIPCVDKFTVIEQAPPKVASISFSPDTVDVSKPLTVTITGVNTKIGQESNCSSSNGCTNIGSYFTYYYQGSPSFAISGTLPLSDYHQINDSVATVKFTAPPNAGICSIITQWGTYMTNMLNIVDNKIKTFSFTPNIGTENTELNISITGNNTKIGQGTSCQNDTNCRIIGTSFYTDTNLELPILEYLQIDDYHASAKIKLPAAGNYNYLTTSTGIKSTNSLNVNPKPLPNFSFTPDIGFENNEITLLLTSNNTMIGQDSACIKNPDCKVIGSSLFTNTNIELPILDYVQITNYQAEIKIKLPSPGVYDYLYTSSGVQSTNLLTVNAIPNYSYYMNTNQWEENTLLKTLITSNTNKISRNSSCLNDLSCKYIGDTIYFTSVERDTTYIQKRIIETYEQVDDYNAYISFITPDSGTYYSNINKNIFSTSTLYIKKIDSLFAEISGSNNYCRNNNNASVYVSFTSLPPWNIKYIDGTDTTNVTNIDSNPFMFNKLLDSTTTYKLIEVTNIRGEGKVNGEAVLTLLNDSLPTATIFFYDTTSNNSAKLKIKLTGQSPWTVVLNDGYSDTTLYLTENESFYEFNTLTTKHFSLQNVLDNGYCGYGIVNGELHFDASNNVTFINNDYNLSQINLYPNPTTGIINLENVVNATLFNVLGEEILKTSLNQIDISEMPKGLYYLQATDAKNKLHSVKIVKE